MFPLKSTSYWEIRVSEIGMRSCSSYYLGADVYVFPLRNWNSIYKYKHHGTDFYR